MHINLFNVYADIENYLSLVTDIKKVICIPSDQNKGKFSKSFINATVFNEMVRNLARIHEENFCKNFKKIGCNSIECNGYFECMFKS